MQSFHFVVLAGERLDHANRRQHLFHDGSDFSLFLSHCAGRLFDAPGIAVDDRKQHWRHRQCDQSESPVQIKHYRDHTQQGDDVNQYAQQPLRNKTLDRVDVTGDSADQIAGALLIMEGKR